MDIRMKFAAVQQRRRRETPSLKWHMVEKRDKRGFGIYLDIPADQGHVKVKGSSLAFEGAHVRIYQHHPEWPNEGESQYWECIHVNVAEAEQIVAALNQWISDVKEGLLIEPLEYTSTNLKR
jgi:hypothetical protein